MIKVPVWIISTSSFKRVKLCISCVLPNVCLHKKDFCVKGKNIFRNDSNWLISWIILSNWQFLVVRRAMTWKRNYIVLIGFLTSFWQSRLNKCLYVLIISVYCKSMFQCFIIFRIVNISITLLNTFNLYIKQYFQLGDLRFNVW